MRPVASFLQKSIWLLFLFFIEFSVFAANLPVLGNGKSISGSGKFVETAASFYGGISENHTDYHNYLQPKLSSGLTIQGSISVAPEDIGKAADLLVVIGRESGLPYEGGVDTLYYSISSQGQADGIDLYASPYAWMSRLEKTPYSNAGIVLENESLLEFQLDSLSAPAMYYIFIGYRLHQNGTIVYSAHPMMLEMAMTTASSSLPFVVTSKTKVDPLISTLSATFVNQEKAIVGQVVTSNSLISSKTETISLIGDAQLVVNGNVAGQTASVNPNDAIALTTTAMNGRKEVSVKIADKSLTWTVQGVAAAPEIPALPGKMSGYTPVNCEVSESGAAICQLPLTAPAGTGGMAPKLSLGYNSQGNNGPVGVGWSLNGLSAITRCRATQAQDGLTAAVDFDANDRFCLDGERLMAVQGEYGAEGTVYYTEQHTFQKVVSFLDSETKMQRFKVWTKTGLILEYGFTTDSSIEAQGRKDVMIWAVNEIQDTRG